MSFTRIPLKLTRLFEIHLDETNPTAHGDNGVPRYLTTALLERAAAEGIGRPGSYSLNIIPDIDIADDARNCVLAYRSTDGKFASDKPYTVLDVRVNGSSTLNTNMQSDIPLTDNETTGFCKLSDGSAASDNVAATPINVKTQMGNSVFAKFHFVSNIPNGSCVATADSTAVHLNSGASVNLASGSYHCIFGNVTGYDRPISVYTSYTAGTEKVVTCTYTKATGKLRVFLDNPNGRWTLDIAAPIANWHESGYEEEVLLSNDGQTFTVYFNAVGGVTPSYQTVKLYKGKITYANGIYNS